MFLGYIHSFRALAIFFIVAGHSIDAMSWSSSFDFSRLLRIFMSNGSVLFVFIAGYLFQHLSVKYSPKKYYLTKIKNVIVPYLLVSIPAILIFVFVLERERVWAGFYELPQWQQIISFYLTGRHLAPLWFIPMITLFFIASPLLVYFDKREKIYYLLPIFVVISCLISRGYPHESFIHFFSVYLFGMWASRYKERLNPLLGEKLFLSVAFLSIILLAMFEYFFMSGTMTWVNYLQKMVACFFYLGLFIYFGELNKPLINRIADTSFGIFFIHSYILTSMKIAYEKTVGTLPQGNVLLYGVITLLVLFICYYLILLVKKLFGHNSRYLVGS